MATDLEKAWKIVSGHRSFIGPDDTMPEDIAKAIVEGITLGRKEGLELAANPENAQLGVNIVQGADISWDLVCDQNQRRFRGVPPAMNDSMLDLDGLSRVAGKAVFARFGGGQLQTVFTQKRLFICSIRVTPWYFRASGRVASS